MEERKPTKKDKENWRMEKHPKSSGEKFNNKILLKANRWLVKRVT